MPGQLAFISDSICLRTALAHVSTSSLAQAAALLAPGMAGTFKQQRWLPLLGVPLRSLISSKLQEPLEAAAFSILAEEE